MILAHQTIERLIDAGEISIGPDFDKKDIRPVGIRIHLAKDILIPAPGQTFGIGDGQEPRYGRADLSESDFLLEPGGFVLGSTYETVRTPPNVLAILDGRSTVARLGLTVHVTSSVVDGTIGTPQYTVLEIKNVGNFTVRLRHRDPIAMMIFAKLSDPVGVSTQAQAMGWLKPDTLDTKSSSI